jgi:predicted ester cyclase
MDDAQKTAQIERIFDIFNRKALDELDSIFHPDYVDHSPMGDVQGIDAFKQLVSVWLAAFPDAHYECYSIIVDGPVAAWRARFRGTNSGSLMGMPPTGKSVDVESVHMGRLADDDRPIEHWTGNDMLLMLQQLGLAPEMSAPVG